jgi:hypothetical protein
VTISSVSSETSQIINRIKRFANCYSFVQNNLLLLKKEKRWIALCIVIRLSSIELPIGTSECFSISNKLSVIRIVQKFDIKKCIASVERLDHGFTHVQNRKISLEGLTGIESKVHENEGWNYYGL